jgi:fatty acid omega-hydroxylase
MVAALDAVTVAGAACCVAVLVGGSFDGTDESGPVLAAALVVTLLAATWKPSPPLQPDGSPVPGPGLGVPFLGAAKIFNDNFDDILNFCVRQCEEYGWGKTWGMSMVRVGPLSRGLVYLSTPEAVQYVLKDNFENFEKGDAWRNALSDFMGDGIFAADGVQWKFHRKVAVRMFSKRLLEEGTAVALSKAHELIARLDRHAESGEPVDLQQCYFAFTMDTFCDIAFGQSLDSQESNHEFTHAFDRCQQLCNDRFRNPFFGLSRFVGTPAEREIKATMGVMRDFALGIIKGRRRSLAAGEKLGPDLISRFVESAGDDDPISDDELVDIVINFLIAGRDTTACALSWASLRLIRADVPRRRMTAEVAAACSGGGGDGSGGGGGSGGTSSSAAAAAAHGSVSAADQQQLQNLPHEDIFQICHQQLPYTRAVMTETLRLHPSVPKDAKYSKHPDVLPDGTRIGAGVACFWSNYCMGRNPLIWPTPLEFRPERWLLDEQGPKEDAKAEQAGGSGAGGGAGGSLWKPTPQVSDFKYPVFNAGPRLCLGRPLAYLEMVMVIAIVFGRYELTETQEHTDDMTQGLVAPMKDGLSVTVVRRR